MLFCALTIAATCAAQSTTVKTSKEKFDDGTTVTIHSITGKDGAKKITSITVDKSVKDSAVSLVAAGDDDGSVIITKLPTKLPLMVSDTMPEFAGGMSALMAFLHENMHYPEDAKKAQKEGRVICSFVVSDKGKVTNAHIVKSSGTESLDEEALRIINAMPDWTPGIQNGETVNVNFTLPITFKLQ